VKVPPLQIECPECAEVIPVPLIMQASTVVDGSLSVNVEPDMADLWAHAWTHTEVPS
jgi:hypothetical protein